MISVFVSHSVKDAEIVNPFVDVILHGALNIALKNIFCVSTEGSKIKSGEDWRQAILQAITETKVTFLIITPYYKESEMCLNEMGAAWVNKGLVIPLIVEPINFRSVGPIPEVSQCEKLLDDAGLDHVRDELQRVLELSASDISSGRWTAKKKEFLKCAKEHLLHHPFPMPLERAAFEKLAQDNKANDEAIEYLNVEIQRLNKLNNDLIAAKDKKEVQAILRASEESDEFEEFEQLATQISKLLSQLSASIRGVVFRSFTGKETKFNLTTYGDDLADAVAEDFVSVNDDNGFVDADWYTTKLMKDLYSKLNELDHLIGGEPPSTFIEAYEAEYEAPLKMSNKSFWEEVFATTIYIN